MTPPDGADLTELLDGMIYHARSQEAARSVEFLRRAVPNYSAADLPEARVDYPL
jgi:hypothetical protein